MTNYDAWGDIQDIPLPPKYSSMVCGGSKQSGAACGICEMCLDGARLPQPQTATLRDHFAMAALAGLLRKDKWRDPFSVADHAYAIADTMMKQREVGK